LKTYKFLLIAFMLALVGCKPVSTEEIIVDRNIVQKQIAELEKELSGYESGAVSALLKLRIETLKHTDDMLALKLMGINRFIGIHYSIDGKTYQRPSNYKEQVRAIESDIKIIERKIDELQKESAKYSGGFVQAMLLMQIETQKLTLAMMDQKRLGILYEFPAYFNPEVNAEVEKEKARTMMKGPIEENI
jgi:hypothetical protein